MQDLNMGFALFLSRRTRVAFRVAHALSFGALLSCAGSSPQAKSAEQPPLTDPILEAALRDSHGRRTRTPSGVSPGGDSGARGGSRGTSVQGITGSLNKYEVEQAMHAREQDLLGCVSQRPRSLGHVAGEIAFHVDVDARGRAERARVMQSDIGYAPLEDCLLEVVATTPFPLPAGSQHAEAQWRMSVDPLQRSALPLDPEELNDVMGRHADATYESCELDKAQRFLVTGYVGRSRKLRPVRVRLPWGTQPQELDANDDQLACVSRQLERWQGFSKGSGVAKATFELHWVAPPPKRGRGPKFKKGQALRSKRR